MKKFWMLLMAMMCVGMAQAQDSFRQIVVGGDLEGENDCVMTQCSVEGYQVVKGYPDPEPDAGYWGSQGVKLVCPRTSSHVWDTEIWLVFGESLHEGERYHLQFDYKCSSPDGLIAKTNFQDSDGNLFNSEGIGEVEFTDSWQRFGMVLTVPYQTSSWAAANSIRSLCLQLGSEDGSREDDIDVFIDNVSVIKYEYDNPEVTGECGVGLKWCFNQATGLLTIDGEGEMTDYEYQETAEGLVSTAPWYAYNDEILAVQMGKGVTKIGSFAFMDLPNATKFTLPSTLTTLGRYAFWYCSKMKTIKLPASLTTLQPGVFRQCGLQMVALPELITDVPAQCFYNCPNLTDVTFGNNVTSIGDKAFYQCQKLQYAPLPAGLITLGTSVFSLTSLKEVAIPQSMEKIGDYAFSQSGLETVTFNTTSDIEMGKQVFYDCKSLQQVNLSEGLTTIPYATFVNCSSLTAITLPASITTIGDAAFSACGIGNVTCLGTVPPTCPFYAFDHNSETMLIHARLVVPQGTKETYEMAETWGYFEEILELEPEQPEVLAGTCGENLTWSIDHETGTLCITGTGAMTDYGYSDSQKAPWSEYANYIDHVVVGEGVTSIGDFAFMNLYFTDIILPEGIESIGYDAFWNCSNLSTISLPSTLKEILSGAFVACNSLESIVIPEGVKTIEAQLFGQCTSLTQVTIPSTVESIEPLAFVYCESLKEIIIPAKVKSIGTNAFYSCPLLKNITCLSTTPPTLSAEAFNTTPLGAEMVIPATLHVPAGTVGTYREAEVWKTFRDIVALEEDNAWECTHVQGDVNGDGKVTIADVNRLIEILKKLKIEN